MHAFANTNNCYKSRTTQICICTEVKAFQNQEFKEIRSLRKTPLTSIWLPEWVPVWVVAVHKAAVIEELSILNTSATSVLLPSPKISYMTERNTSELWKNPKSWEALPEKKQTSVYLRRRREVTTSWNCEVVLWALHKDDNLHSALDASCCYKAAICNDCSSRNTQSNFGVAVDKEKSCNGHHLIVGITVRGVI